MVVHTTVWEIAQDKLVAPGEVNFAEPNRESVLCDWVAHTPEFLGDNVLIILRDYLIPEIGRVPLLGIDPNGKLVIVKSQGNLGPREAVAHALELASWLHGATREEIVTNARQFLNREMAQAFRERFQRDLPDWSCQNHRAILIASRMDSHAERLIGYLSQKQALDISVVLLKCFVLSDGKEILIRSTMSPEVPVEGVPADVPADEHLLEIATQRNTLPMLEICRQLKDLWREERAKVYGGSYRYWAASEGGEKVICGIDIGGELADAQPGELDVWINIPTLAHVAETFEANARYKLSQGFSVINANSHDFVVRLKSPGEAAALVSELKGLLKFRTAVA
jgi:hypothetical protein